MAETDHDLIAAARAGDRRALEALLARHQAQVFRFGLKMCRAEEDAKDVLQDTLFAAARTLPEFREASSVSTWLYTIARSFCLKRRRRSKFAPEVEESLDAAGVGEQARELPDPGRAPDAALEGHRLEDALDDAIGALDPMYREVLVLRDVEGLAAAEVAEVLGVTVEAVKSRLHRARVAVRERLAPLLAEAAPAPAAEAAPGACQDVVLAFSRHLEGEIDGEVCAQLERHLAGCPACQRRCDSLRATLRLCRGAGEVPVPLRVERSVREALRAFLSAPSAR